MAESTPYPLLNLVSSPKDVRELRPQQLLQLCTELRNFLIETILQSGGHFSANLGVVELTAALHYVFNTPEDILIWDVGHQSYAHKVITGRKNLLENIRQKGGISGFPSRSESVWDAFGTGHSSTSISAALGFAESARMKGINRQHIAVIGDGSLTAGQAFEALNNAGNSKANVLIVVNDNDIGIDPNSGALQHHLRTLDLFENSDNIFSVLGLDYYGPYDGHNVDELTEVFKHQHQLSHPRVVHIKTQKGKGYAPAEKESTKWHAANRFVKVDIGIEEGKGVRFQDVFGKTITELAALFPNVVAITPAMPTGCGLTHMMEKYPDRVFDTGIAEQHAVTFAAGMAADGLIPFCNIYSTFLQRGYDQVIHDVCIQNLPVIFCIDRAGVVGEDGATHQGIYDLAFLQMLPNLTIAAPRNESELRNMLYSACLHQKGPIAIRYPRGKGNNPEWEQPFKPVNHALYETLAFGEDALLIGTGVFTETMLDAAKILSSNGFYCEVDYLRFVKPLDQKRLKKIAEKFRFVFFAEDGVTTGGIGQNLLVQLFTAGFRGTFLSFGLPDEVIEHGTREEILANYGLDAQSISSKILSVLKEQQ